ncbi:MAG: hypothetical protein HYX60_07475 [Legionella longbeachae]|nr:hypothetical protein [Legionella longbeachae]
MINEAINENHCNILNNEKIEINCKANTDEKTWDDLFSLINQTTKNTLTENKITELEQVYLSIPEKDPLLKALESIHDQLYLVEDIIPNCIKQFQEGDIVYSHHYFQMALEEINQVANLNYDFLVNIGLPSHHAFVGKASGFCIINKLAVLMAIEKSKQPNLHFAIIGLDVNQDDGLKDCLRNARNGVFKGSNLQHIDVHDPRVFPWPKKEIIKEEFKSAKTKHEEDNPRYFVDKYEYSIFDLSKNKRKQEGSIHPVIKKSLEQVEESIKKLADNEKIMIVVPLGWDSHQEETACCGRRLNNGRFLSKDESIYERFSDTDMEYFYNALCDLKKTYASKVHKVLVSLEGGYNNELNKKQIKILNESLEKNFNLDDQNKKNFKDNNTFFENLKSKPKPKTKLKARTFSKKIRFKEKNRFFEDIKTNPNSVPSSLPDPKDTPRKNKTYSKKKSRF